MACLRPVNALGGVNGVTSTDVDASNSRPSSPLGRGCPPHSNIEMTVQFSTTAVYIIDFCSLGGGFLDYQQDVPIVSIVDYLLGMAHKARLST